MHGSSAIWGLFRERRPKMWSRVYRIVLSLPFIIAAGLFGLYLLFGFFLVNPLAQKLLPWVGQTKLASQLSAEHVKFNPLTLEITVDGLKLAKQKGELLAGIDQLYINIGTTGLFRWALRIQDVQLKHPRATFAVQPDGTLNWASLLAKLNEGKKPPSSTSTMPRVLIDHISIDDGDIEYTDANRPDRPFKLAIRPLGIELNGLSLLTEGQGTYRITANLPEQGGSLTLKGDIALNPLSSAGEIAMEGMQLADLQGAIKSPPNFIISSGTLAVGMRYRFAMVLDNAGVDSPSVQVHDAILSVQKLKLSPRGSNAPALELAELQIDNANMDLTERRVEVARVGMTRGRLSANRNVKGALDLQMLFADSVQKTAPASFPSVQSNSETSAPAQPERPWKIAVHEIKLADWSARFTDRGFAKPIVVSADGFGMTAALTGEVGAQPAIEFGPVNAVLGPIRVLSGEQEAAVLQHAAVRNAKLTLVENRLLIDAVELRGLRTSVVMDKNKTINWVEIMKPSMEAPVPALVNNAAVKSTAAKPTATDKPGMDVELSRFNLERIDVSITDQSTGTPVTLDFIKGFVAMKNLSVDLNKAVPVEAGFGFTQGGMFNVGGTVTPGKASGKLGIKLVGLSLKPFTPYINQLAKLNLQSGLTSARGKLMFARTQEKMGVIFNGGFSVDDLAITEEKTGDPFLGWEKLSSDSLEINMMPNRLHMNELVALNPFGKVVIFEDKTINLKRILRSSEPESAAKVKAGGSAPVNTEKPDEAEAFPFAIERLRIIGANAEFADNSLTPQFGTKMHDLGGVVTGLSNEPASLALVELDGKVDEFGSVRVRGSVQPFRATDFTDLKLSFRNLDMTNLTPYSGRFAGRKVDAGKLSVDLEYKIKQRQLEGENKVVINKLKLGERVESPESLNLPLDLALAILEDKEGVIDLDLPVSGNLDDPKFSYGRIIWKAIVNVLTKVATAPFRALGRLIGISSDKLEDVAFDFGTATLLPPEQEKLKIIGEALAKRPALTLSVSPAYDPRNDTRAIQELRIRRDVAQGMGLKIAAYQEPGPVDTANPRTQEALEALYSERFGEEGGMKVMKAAYAKSKQRGKTMHADILERLTLQIFVAEVELKQMAEARGEAMKHALMTLGKVDPAKISVVEPAPKDDNAKVVTCKLSLSTGKKSIE